MLPLELLVLRRLRRRLYPFASGQVLELGVGTGANLPFYDPEIRLCAIDTSWEMLDRARRRPSGAPATLIQADVLSLPFAADHFDHVVGSLVFCSITDPHKALLEIRRVLRPGGWLVLLEHVRGEFGLARRLTDWLERPWYRYTQSCHLNRDTARWVREAGLEIACTMRHALGIVQVILARNV